MKVDYKALAAEAQEIRKIAAEMKKRTLSDIENTAHTAKADWKGGAAESFFRKYSSLAEQITAEVNRLYDIANSLDNLAEKEKAKIII